MIHLLAAANDDPVKFVFGAIVFVIWVVGSIMSAASKKREQERRERARESIQMDREIDRPLPPQLPLPAPARTKPPARQVPPLVLRRIDTPPRQQQPRPIQKQPKLRRKSAAAPPIRLPQPVARPDIPARTPIEAARPSPAQPAPARPTSATASTLRSWLTPATLRQQFILTEVLQPPISLR